jgi:hypothetical protein
MPLLSANAVAYPFIKVDIVPPPAPVMSRSPGVIAVVGKTPAGATGGAAPLNAPREVGSPADAVDLFASRTAGGAPIHTALSTSLTLAFQQDPRPAKIYGVRVDGDSYADALSALEAVDDVTFVALAHEYAIDPLMALKAHVEDTSAAGSKRIGVAMADPTRARGQTWAAETVAALTAAGKVLKSDDSRMIVVAGRAASDALAPDFATAAMSAIAGLQPQVSPVLKQVRGVPIPKELQYSPSEIKALSAEGIIPIIDPELIPGDGQFMAEGVLFTSDANRPYVDIVRVLDDLEFRLRAGLIGTVSDARITRPGLTLVKATAEGILGPLKQRAVIDDFTVAIPLLDRLSIPEAARTAADTNEITNARATRGVDMTVTVVYGPQIHQLGVKLRMVFA